MNSHICHASCLEYLARRLEDFGFLGVGIYVHRDTADERGRSVGPKMWLGDGLNASNGSDLLNTAVVSGTRKLARRLLQQDTHTGLEQWDDGDGNQQRDDQRADGVCNLPIKQHDEDTRDDDTHATQRICEDVQKDSIQIVRVFVVATSMAVTVAMAVAVSMVVIMIVIVAVIVAVIMTVIVAVIVTVMIVSALLFAASDEANQIKIVEGKDTNQVDHQSQEGDQQQAIRVDLWGRDDAYNRFDKDRYGNEAQKDTIRKSSQHFYSSKSVSVSFFSDQNGLPIGKHLVGIPFGDDRGIQPNRKGSAVKQHVEGVGDQSQTIRPETIQQLHKHESKIGKEEQEDFA